MILELKKYAHRNYSDEQKRKEYLREYRKKYSNTQYFTKKMQEYRNKRQKRNIEFTRGDIYRDIEQKFDISDFKYIENLPKIPESIQKVYFPKMRRWKKLKLLQDFLKILEKNEDGDINFQM